MFGKIIVLFSIVCISVSKRKETLQFASDKVFFPPFLFKVSYLNFYVKAATSLLFSGTSNNMLETK